MRPARRHTGNDEAVRATISNQLGQYRPVMSTSQPNPTGDQHQRMTSYGYGYGMRLA